MLLSVEYNDFPNRDSITHPIFICSKLTIEALEQGVKYVQNYQ